MSFEVDNYEDFMRLKKEDLKELVKALGLKCSGNKSDLCERLVNNTEKLALLREQDRLDPEVDTCISFSIDDLPSDVIGNGTLGEAPVGLKRKIHIIPITIEGQTIGLEMFISVNCQVPRKAVFGENPYQILKAELQFPREYSSAFSDASKHKIAIAVIVTHQNARGFPPNQPMLMKFYSNRQKQEGELQTPGERKALRGIASKMLCYVLIYGVEVGLFKMDSILSLEASGSAPGRAESDLALMYESLGFHLVEDSSIRGLMEAQVGELIEMCNRN